MQRPDGIDVVLLAEFVIVESFGADIYEFIEKSFGEFQIIEHISNLFRIKLDSTVSVGKIFGDFEDNKERLNIEQYSIR